ncbi:MAG TPA: ferritin family protein [Armatimonadota bacterium]|nr:ferritin family protein [Armatimonadota bacterium]
MSISKDEIVTAAIQLEGDGFRFYTDAAKNAGSTLSRETFDSLAKDEQRHIEWITDYTKLKFNAETANKALYAQLRPVFADLAESDRQVAGSADADIDALKFAIKREVAARDAYAKWADEVDDPEVKDLCEKLVEVEDFHRELLENVIEYLDNPTDYFLREERWIVEG